MSADAPRPEPRCKHIYPGGERCSLPADIHESVVGLADRHGYPPPSTPRPERVTLTDEEREALAESLAEWHENACDAECVTPAVARILSAREQALREERDAARAALDRVEALADEWERDWDDAVDRGRTDTGFTARKGAARRIRAALRGETR